MVCHGQRASQRVGGKECPQWDRSACGGGSSGGSRLDDLVRAGGTHAWIVRQQRRGITVGMALGIAEKVVR